MLKFAVEADGPVALRYPKGEAYAGLEEFRETIVAGKAEIISRGSGIALLAVGSMVRTAVETAALLQKGKKTPTVVNMRFVKPFDKELLRELAEDHSIFVTMEENMRHGGFGEQVLDFVQTEGLPCRVCIIAAPDRFIQHGSVESQRKEAALDADSIVAAVTAMKEKE